VKRVLKSNVHPAPTLQPRSYVPSILEAAALVWLVLGFLILALIVRGAG
jgi:hypothetical protein